MTARAATAVSHPNIALAKYWGKRAIAGNVPATPSVSVVLDGLETRTSVTFDSAMTSDTFTLDGEPASVDRVTRLLDEVRSLAGTADRAHVVSQNSFPTASGLASSASGFSALAVASCAALRLDLDARSLSRIARRASASAARSVLGGFVALGTDDDPCAESVAPASHWPIAIVVAAVTSRAKNVLSTQGMEHVRQTSPYYDAWVADAPKVAAAVRAAIVARDLEALGMAAEASAFAMHACAIAARPAILYWSPATLSLLSQVRSLRADGISAWATIDAGPHVKVIVDASDASRVADRLAPHAERIIVAKVGEGARVVEAPT